MRSEQIANFQREEAASTLMPLVMSCRSRFLRSADLVALHSTATDGLRKFGVIESVDLSPLLSAWDVLCKRYVAECYSPQVSLFPEAPEEKRKAWYSFVYHVLYPQLVQEDEFVRNILRALGALPCRCPREAAEAVAQHFSEMTLPESSPSSVSKEGEEL